MTAAIVGHVDVSDACQSATRPATRSLIIHKVGHRMLYYSKEVICKDSLAQWLEHAIAAEGIIARSRVQITQGSHRCVGRCFAARNCAFYNITW
jgi:hypothetical protein